MTELEAVHRAYAKLDELRRARMAEPGAQLDLASGAPRTFAQAVDEWERRKTYRTPDGANYGKKYAKSIRAELGAYLLSDFAGVQGDDRLLAYQRSIAGLASRTQRNRFGVVMQVLKLASRRHWIASLPTLPDLPTRPAPKFEWIDEPTFRALRDGIALARGFAPPAGETLAAWTERRRLYLSWAFYTGSHNRDADLLDDSHVSIDVGIYIRRNSKSAAHVPDEQFELPEPLIDDLRRLLFVLGREAFYCGERLAGGPWASVNKVLCAAQRRLGIPGASLNMRILRRSFAREMFRRGYSVREVQDRMGHADPTMLTEVYTRTPRPPGAARTRWTHAPVKGAPRGANTLGRVLAFDASHER